LKLLKFLAEVVVSEHAKKFFESKNLHITVKCHFKFLF